MILSIFIINNKAKMKLFILYIICIVYLLGEFIFFKYTLNNIDLLIAEILPLKTYKNLSSPENFRKELHRVGGVYGLINTLKRLMKVRILNNILALVKIYIKD